MKACLFPLWLPNPFYLYLLSLSVFGSQDPSFRVTKVLFAKAKPAAICEGGERDERWGMSPNQCQNTPLGCYLQTRVLGASSRDHMNQNRVTEDRGRVSAPPGLWVTHLVEASHSLLTNSGDVGHTKKRPQSHPLQRVRTNTCLVRTKLLHLRGQNQTQGKRRGENKEWQ